MKRDIYKSLISWKQDKHRRPLILRGARQTGKTYLVEAFGREQFEGIVSLNFERNPEYKDIFTQYVPKEIIEKTMLFTGRRIEQGKTLLFLDEIQDCPDALMSLRYFYEELPALHIIAAGSLLEFALRASEYRVPVGRIQYMYLKPMSFGEFLDANGQDKLRQHIRSGTNLARISGALHTKINEWLRKYYIIGGMPAVVEEYTRSQDVLKCQQIQHALVETFTDDFGKYAREVQTQYLQKIFYSIPGQTGKKFIYAEVDRTIKSRELRQAVELLTQAGICIRVNRSSGDGLPLEAGIKPHAFKLIILDIGLMHSIAGLYSETARQKDFTAIYNGAVAEQFVGQELMAYQAPEMRPQLYYWAREAKSSSAEVDYIVAHHDHVVPIEVKSGPKGRMKSLFLFRQKYQSAEALKISQATYSPSPPVTNLPLYAIETWMSGELMTQETGK